MLQEELCCDIKIRQKNQFNYNDTCAKNNYISQAEKKKNVFVLNIISYRFWSAETKFEE